MLSTNGVLRSDGAPCAPTQTNPTDAVTSSSDQGNNSRVIATSSQANTVYLLANKHGVESPEAFALLLAEHFLLEYPWVTSSRVTVRVKPWERMVVDDKPHNHAFVTVPTLERFTEVSHLLGVH